ncbi:GTPase [Nanoarchaeota archaeon]
MPINASPHFERAQAEYEAAETTEQKIRCLKKMLVLSPKHKGAENLNAQLKRRLARLKYTKEKEDRSGKSTYKGIKKEGLQTVILGKTNTGKSSLISILTNAQSKISEIKFQTTEPIIGMTTIETVPIQLIENPAIESEFYDKGLTNSADTLILLITNLKDLEEIKPLLKKSTAKQIIVFNKTDKLNEQEKRKIRATLQSKKYNFVMISTKNASNIKNSELNDNKVGVGGRGCFVGQGVTQNLEELKNKIFQTFDKIRIYTKEPGKEKSKKPMILKQNSTISDAAEKILKGFSKNIKQTKIWGPSSKFSGQIVGLKHKLKDLDVVEFKTK